MQNRVALNQIQIGDDLTRQFTCIPRKPETRYAGIRLSGGRTSLSLDHSARNARAGVVPAVFVGIGQLAGCNGAIRSAVPFRCFASRTYSLSLSLSPSFSLPLCLSTIRRRVGAHGLHLGWTSVRSQKDNAYMRHDLLDHLRTHEKDRRTLIHINSYTYITHIPGELSTFPSLSKMHLFHLTLPSLFRDTYFVPLLPVQRFRYFRDGWPS